MRKRRTAVRVTASALAVCLIAGCMPVGTARQVKAADMADANWEEIQSIVGRYYGEWKDTLYSGAVTDRTPNTALLGNGDVGITSGGDETSKTFYVSKSDFWAYNGKPMLIGGVTIGEKQKEVIETGENLAPTYKTVTASSIYENFYPEFAVNGDMQQSENGYGWVTYRPQDEQQGGKKEFWLQLEFEEPITIARYVVKSDGAVRPGYEANNTSDFELQISDTGEEGTWIAADTVVGNAESIFDKNLDTPVQAKYVRLFITKPTQETNADNRQNPRARIGQFELYAEEKEDTESKNYALNKPVKVCSAYTDRGVTHGGDFMVDGNTSTKWCSLHDDESVHWAIVDLGEKKNIGYYKILHSGVVGETQHNTVAYQLQYLDSEEESWDSIDTIDESLWKDMDVVNGNTSTTTSKAFDTPVSARYVRLLVTNPAPGNKAARIHELDLREEAPLEFYEKQDILNAEIQTTQELADVPTEMKTWLASDSNVLVTELKSIGTEDGSFQVDTWASTNNKANRPITAVNDEASVTVTRSTENSQPDNDESHVSKAALSTKIIGAENVVAESDDKNGKGNLTFILPAGETVYIVTAVGGGGRTYHNDGSLWEDKEEPESEAADMLDFVSDTEALEELNSARQDWWKDFWSASYVDFGSEDENLNKVQKYYYGAQYILGSTVKEGKEAPGLFGIWHTTDNAAWSSDYHLNYNFIATFYGTNSSNRSELSIPGVEALLGFVEKGQERASSVDELKRIKSDFVEQKIAKGDIDPEKGIKGAILYPVGIGPWGMTLDNNYHNEALNAVYNSYLMTQYYDYTKDREFLENGVYDFMKQAVAFYEAWLEREETTENEDGYKYVLYAGYNEGSWAINPAVELAALKGTLRNLIRFSEELGRDEDKRRDWIDLYQHLGGQPTTVVNGKTVLALGEKQWNGSSWVDLPSPIPGDGNALPLDAMIPGGVYNYFSSPEDLQMVWDTIDVFSQRGAWSQINNFPRLFPEAVKSRYPVDTVVTKLVDVINRQMAPNLRINDNTHGVEKCGSTETINSMMLITEEGITKLFPNWYTDKDAKFVNLRAKGAFTVSAEYDGTAQEAKNVTITSEAGEDMTLVSPWEEGMTVKDEQGNIVETEKGTVPNWEDQENATYTFATTEGGTYTIEKGDTEAEKPSKNTLEYFLNKAKEHQAAGDVDSCVESIKNLFKEATAEGEAVMADENATYEEVMDATVKLMKAIQALDMKAADKTDLEMAVELAESIDLADYVEAGQAEFEQALSDAEGILSDGDAMQTETEAVWSALVDALSSLRLKADKSALEDLLNSLEGMDLSPYTEESAAVFHTAFASARAVMADAALSVDEQKTVDDAGQALRDAKEQLQLKDSSGGDSSTGDDNIGEGSGDGSGADDPGSSTDNSIGGGADKKADAPKTGDTEIPFGMFTLAAAAVLAAGTARLARRRTNK